MTGTLAALRKETIDAFMRGDMVRYGQCNVMLDLWLVKKGLRAVKKRGPPDGLRAYWRAKRADAVLNRE